MSVIVCAHNEAQYLATCLHSQAEAPLFVEDPHPVREELSRRQTGASRQRRRGAHAVPQRLLGGVIATSNFQLFARAFCQLPAPQRITTKARRTRRSRRMQTKHCSYSYPSRSSCPSCEDNCPVAGLRHCDERVIDRSRIAGIVRRMMTEHQIADAFSDALCRAQGEYMEMPGLQLTVAQASRLGTSTPRCAPRCCRPLWSSGS